MASIDQEQAKFFILAQECVINGASVVDVREVIEPFIQKLDSLESYLLTIDFLRIHMLRSQTSIGKLVEVIQKACQLTDCEEPETLIEKVCRALATVFMGIGKYNL
jgi:hypothetical protein